MSEALDKLRARAEMLVTKRDLSSRRPTWAPYIVLVEELVEALHKTAWRKVDANDVDDLARLWANFTKPKDGQTCVKSFDLRWGRERNGELIFQTYVRGDGTWGAGPKYIDPTIEPRSPYVTPSPQWVERYRLSCRATELGQAAVMAFAGDPEAQMRIGGIAAKACACCGRTLTDAISLEYGIGPECRALLSQGEEATA